MSSRTEVDVSKVRLLVAGPTWNNRPMWVAKVTVLEHIIDGADFLAARNVHVAPASQLHTLPGTMLLRCRVLLIQEILGMEVYESPRRDVDVTLLVHTKPSSWEIWPNQVELDQVTLVTTVAGEIPLEYCPKALKRVGVMVGEAIGGQDKVRASPSGLLLSGAAKMPGDAAPFRHTLPCIVEPDLGGRLLVRPDRASLSGMPEARGEVAAWFSKLIDRANTTDAVARTRCTWARLELMDVATLPDFHWRIDATGASTLAFAVGAWRLVVSDQPPGVPGVSPRGVLVGRPEVTLTPDGSQLKIRGGDAHRPERVPWVRLGGTWEGADWSETVEVQQVRLAYDAVAVAETLRRSQGLSPPRTDDPDAQDDDDRAGAASGVSDGAIDPPVLWGFTPLSDGWAQLPFLNVTEQLLADATAQSGRATAPDDGPPLLGAVVFGVDRPELVNPPKADSGNELPWNVALLGAAAYCGTWELKNQALGSYELLFLEPQVTVEGLFWIATGPMTAADALPTQDDWLTGLRPVALRTARVGDRYPSPFLLFTTLKFSAVLRPSRLSTASLGHWSWSYEADRSVHERLTNGPRPPFPSSRVWGFDEDQLFDLGNPPTPQRSALAWRRHPSHPCVQALPLTQTSTPANKPSRSRQLAPFALPLGHLAVPTSAPTRWVFLPDGWKFSASDARAWPRLERAATPEVAWGGVSGLPMVPLGLPGLALLAGGGDPGVPAAGGSFLPRLQYRHDLPLLDELQALTALPSDGSRVDGPPAPRALLRSDYARWWSVLSDRAILARADAVDALALVPGGGPTEVAVRGILEPWTWRALMRLDLGSYPGSLVLTDVGRDEPLELRLAGDVPREKGDDALRGIEGGFERTGDGLRLRDLGWPSESDRRADVRVVGGSFTATVEAFGTGLGLRDQRGQLRAASREIARVVEGHREVVLVGTDVRGTRDADLVSLLSAKEPYTIQFAGQPLMLWFKDLPTSLRDDGQYEFKHHGGSAARRGVNDPGSLGPEHGHRLGFEWRLGPQSQVPGARAQIGPLTLFPLALRAAKLSATGELLYLEVIARLELVRRRADKGPGDRSELPQEDATVRLVFEKGTLTEVAPAPPDPDPHAKEDTFREDAAPAQVTWPLADPGSHPDTPVLRWSKASLDGRTLVLHDARIVYARHGHTWDVPIRLGPQRDQPYRLPLDDTRPEDGVWKRPPASPQAALERLTLRLDPTKADHTVVSRWGVALGGDGGIGLSATLDEQVLGDTDEVSVVGLDFVVGSGVGRHIPLAEVRPKTTTTLASGGLAFTWDGFAESLSAALSPTKPASRRNSSVNGFAESYSATNAALHVLPGFPLKSCRGLAMAAFDLVAAPGVPNLVLRGACIDVVFDCRGGEFLDEGSDALCPERKKDAVFGASACRSVLEYRSQLAWGNGQPVPTWSASLSITGLLEIKDLISWPVGWKLTPTGVVTIPAVRPSPLSKPDLSHRRHALRVLFAEHEVPDDVLVRSKNPACLLHLRGAWTFPAVVEHQIVTVHVDDACEVRELKEWRRWSVVQEVTLATPKAVYERLKRETSPLTNQPDSAGKNLWQTDTVRTAELGLHAAHTQLALGTVNKTFTSKPFEQTPWYSWTSALVVEAGAALMLGRHDLGDRPTTDLCSVAGGAAFASAIVYADFAYGSPDAWVFATVPFLGRLTCGESPDPNIPLAHDPVRALHGSSTPPIHRMLANWAEKSPIELQVTDLERPARNTGSGPPAWRAFGRLDPAAVDVAWGRLNNARPTRGAPDVNARLPGVMGQTGTSAHIDRARGEVLRSVLEPVRNGTRVAFQAVLVGDGNSAEHPRSFPFVVAPLAFHDWLASQKEASTLHPAVTVVSSTTEVRLALSPLLRLGHRTPDDEKAESLLTTVAEVVAFDVRRTAPVVVAGRLFAGDEDSKAIADWAVESHARMAADSPVAAVRKRTLSAVGMVRPLLITTYQFDVTTSAVQGAGIERLATPVRARSERLRFAEGQFTGATRPARAEAFELAPPLVSGVQPVRLHERPNGPAAWPWGVAAVRISSRVREGTAAAADERNAVGTVGPPVDGPLDTRIWWQGLASPVQFATPEDRKILPDGFRTTAIPAWVPAWARSPLPRTDELKRVLPTTDDQGSWEPVLAGGRRVWVAGARPGVFFAHRETISTQIVGRSESGDQVIVSGSVPVQHRAPRPVLIPRSRENRQTVAVHTWGTWFDLAHPQTVHRTVVVSRSPLATAFHGPASANGGKEDGATFLLGLPDKVALGRLGIDENRAVALDVALGELVPAPVCGGEIPSTWNGVLLVTRIKPASAEGRWELTATLTDGTDAFAFKSSTRRQAPLMKETDPRTGEVVAVEQLVLGDANRRDALLEWVRSRAHGELVRVDLAAKRAGDDPEGGAGDESIRGHAQVASLPLRVARKDGLALYAPRFVLFEDPEYNRRLTSNTARVEKSVPAAAGVPAHRLSLTADRREYNPTGKLLYVFTASTAADGPVLPSYEARAFFFIRRRGADALEPAGVKSVRLTGGVIPDDPAHCDLHTLGGASLRPGDILVVRLCGTADVDGKPNALLDDLELRIVAEPVTPVPDAAYALLRTDPDGSVECVRFAWSPTPDQIELVDPDDLRAAVVRRRAVFRWLDTVRRGSADTAYTYSVQKTTSQGSTHFPQPTEAPWPEPPRKG